VFGKCSCETKAFDVTSSLFPVDVCAIGPSSAAHIRAVTATGQDGLG